MCCCGAGNRTFFSRFYRCQDFPDTILRCRTFLVIIPVFSQRCILFLISILKELIWINFNTFCYVFIHLVVRLLSVNTVSLQILNSEMYMGELFPGSVDIYNNSGSLENPPSIRSNLGHRGKLRELEVLERQRCVQSHQHHKPELG